MTDDPSRGDDAWPPPERRWLADGVPPIALDEDRIRDTVARARAFAALRRRRTRSLRVAAAIAGIGLLMGAGVWRWNGRDSSGTGFGRNLEVLETPRDHHPEKLGVAIGNLDQQLAQLLQDLHARGLMTPDLQDELMAQLAPTGSPRPAPPAEPAEALHDGGFEDLQRRVRATPRGGRLAPAVRRGVIQAVGAAAAAGRRVGAAVPSKLPTSRVFVERLRGYVTAPEAPAGGGRSGRR